MVISKIKKDALTGLGLTLLAFLLLTLFGCNATSDPKVSYQATGSWEGAIGADKVRGIIAPDGRYHLAIVDAQGVFHPAGGEYVGTIGSIDAENIGSMTLQRLQGNESSGAPQPVTFKLSADRLYSLQGIELRRTADANGLAVPGAVAGHWSLAAADNTTEVVINADGTFSGGDGNCRYSGTLQLQTPAWNIYSLNLIISDNTYLSCSLDKGTYSGLAMQLSKEEPRPRLWFAANSLAKTFLGAWSKTENAAPEAKLSILGDRTNTGPESSVLMQQGAAVELDAQGSSDANNDALTYEWSGTAPDRITPLTIQGTGSTATFSPVTDGLFTLRLRVNDGLLDSDPIERQLRVEWTPDRFIGCTNGTVLDTRTNLLWLREASCEVLNTGVGTPWGISHALAEGRVGDLASGVCSLNDNSAIGDWRLPSLNEFSYIVPQSQWNEEGHPFLNVGTNLPYYWTDDPDPATEFNWFFADVSYIAPAEWFGSYFENTASAVWPVRALRPGEQCPPVP